MKVKDLTLSGILAAITVVLVVLTDYIPFNKLFLYGLSSLPIAIIIIEAGIKSGVLFYIATSLLIAILAVDKLTLIPYIIFFGIYGLIKFFIERNRTVFIEYLLKLISFNIILIIGYFLAKSLFNVHFPIWYLSGAEIVFLVYDYAYSYAIRYYNLRLRKIMGRLK